MKKRVLLLLLVVFMIFTMIVTGCSNSKPNDLSGTAENETITVTDQLNREITLPKEVKTIASYYPMATNMLIALGVEDKLIAVQDNASESTVYAKLAPELMNLPGIGRTGKNGMINVEEIMRLNPELLIVPARWSEDLESLEKSGITVFAINPETLESITESFTLLGKAVGAEDRAKELVDYYNEKIEFLNELTANSTEKPKVYLPSHMGVLMASTGDMLQTHLINLAGGTSVSMDIKGSGWTDVSMEQILLWNPELIFYVQYSTYDKTEFTENVQWENIAAVKNNKIYKIPSKIDEWDTPVHTSILGALWMTSKLHPDIYSEDNLLDDIQSYYQQFYGLEVTVDELGL
jgi:iron complex transport system substrate-binding protein